MKQHERDYFVSRIRNGKYRIQIFKQELEILSPTIEDEYYINKAYIKKAPVTIVEKLVEKYWYALQRSTFATHQSN